MWILPVLTAARLGTHRRAGAPEASVAATVNDPAASQVTPDGSAAVLSVREREIVALVAGGANRCSDR
jgi:hypothetical protein